MTEEWKAQLEHQDPKVRAQAVKAIALSGDQSKLKYLIEIGENDPDPRLREYAKKAAKHLYASVQGQKPEETSPPPAPKPEPKPAPTTTAPEAGDEEALTASLQQKISLTDRTNAESKIQRSLSQHMNGKTQRALKTFVQGLDLNPNLENDTFTRSVAGELTGMNPDQAIRILKDHEARQELLNPPKEKSPQPSQPGETGAPPETGTPPEKGTPKAESAPGEEIPLVQIWLRFFKMTEDFFRRIVAQANTEDTLISVLVYMIASMLTFLISSFGQLQRMTDMLGQELGGQIPDLSPFLLGILISMIFVTPLSFFFGAGIQFLGMRVFRGQGSFKEHSYVLAMVIVPMTILSLALTLPALVPGLNCIAGLAGFGLSIFSIVLMVRGMKAVHNLPTGQTIAGLIIPPLVLAIIAGCLFSLLGSALMGMLANMMGIPGGLPQ